MPSGSLDLVRLIDLAAEQADINIEYNPDEIRGKAHLRLREAISTQQLWNELNQILISRDLVLIRSESLHSFRVVRLETAADRGHVFRGFDELADASPMPGFATIAYHTTNVEAAAFADAIRPLLTDRAGKAVAVPDATIVLISDTTPRLILIDEAAQSIDRANLDAEIVEFRSDQLEADQIIEHMQTLLQQQREVAQTTLRGKLSPSVDGRGVFLVAPKDSLPAWTALFETIDRLPALETHVYPTSAVAPAELASLIRETLRLHAGASDPQDIDIVVDAVTSSLIIRATPAMHARIDQLIQRIESAPRDARLTTQTFVVRNRPVDELLGVIESLIESGFVSSADTKADQEIQTSRLDDATDVSDNESRQDGPRSVVTESIRLTADLATNRIIAVGEPRILAQIGSLIEQIDIRQPQVMLEVLIVSLTDDQTLDLGVELERLSIVMGGTSFSLSSFFGLSSSDSGDGTVGRGQGFTGAVFNPGEFSVVVRALETVTGGRAMSRPKLLVGNNQEAVLTSVLQAPFASTNASTTVATTSFGGTQDAGTTVTIRPQIAEGDHLVLEYSVALSTFVGESSSPALPPPRQQNQLQSIVTIPDGFTVAVGGLEFTTEGEAVSQIPLLGDIPGLGELFKSRSKSQTKSHFYVFIRPNILRRADFADLRWISAPDLAHAGIPDDWPSVEPRIIR